MKRWFQVLLVMFLTGCGSAVAPAVNRLDPGTLVVCSPLAPAVIAVDPQTGAQRILSSGGMLVNPEGATIGLDGSLYVVDPSAGTDAHGLVLRVDPTTGSQTIVCESASLVDPNGIVADTDGTLLVADPDAFATPPQAGPGGVFRVHPDTGVLDVVSSKGLLAYPFGLAFDLQRRIVVADGHLDGTGGVVRVDPATGAQERVASGAPFNFPVGIAAEAGGTLVLSNFAAAGTGNLVRVDPLTQSVTVLASNFQNPAGVAVEADGSLVTSDYRGGTVVRVNPSTGAQTVVASGPPMAVPVPGGQSAGPFGICVVPAFATFTASLEVRPPQRPAPSSFELRGTFTLAATSNGVDPTREVVTVRVGGSDVTISAGSFRALPRARYMFSGLVGTVTVVAMFERADALWSYRVVASGVDAGTLPETVRVALFIGDEGGVSEVTGLARAR